MGGSEGEIEVPDSVMSQVSSNGFDCLLLSDFSLRWITGCQSLGPTKSLLEVLKLLVDGLLGGFHLDEAVDEALAVGLDALF